MDVVVDIPAAVTVLEKSVLRLCTNRSGIVTQERRRYSARRSSEVLEKSYNDTQRLIPKHRITTASENVLIDCVVQILAG